MIDPNLMAQLPVPEPAPTCVYRDEEGVLCGAPAPYISCKPETDSPTCRTHKCACWKLLGVEELEKPDAAFTRDTVLSMLGGLKSQPASPPTQVRDEVGTIAIVQALKELREVSVELGRALEREQRLLERLSEIGRERAGPVDIKTGERW